MKSESGFSFAIASQPFAKKCLEPKFTRKFNRANNLQNLQEIINNNSYATFSKKILQLIESSGAS